MTATKDQLFLTRKDLNKGSCRMKIAEIDIRSFRIPLRAFAHCSYADFTDDDGTVKILKSRSGTPIQSKIVRMNITPAMKVKTGEISAKDLLSML